MVPLPPLRDGGCALPICPFGRACLPLISDAPDCKCSPGRLWFLGGVGEMPESRCTDFNPRALCGARPDRRPCRPDDGGISIHAPRVGRDVQAKRGRCRCSIFQSTRPVWGATTVRSDIVPSPWISIHAPRVGRDGRYGQDRPSRCNFNPRAPCGARRYTGGATESSLLFQSTRPVWGATFNGLLCFQYNAGISIHAPRVGRDWLSQLQSYH